MVFKVPKLNYPQDALEPYLSADIVHYHYDKHTKGYFKKTNELIKGTMFEKVSSLDDMVNRKSLVRAKTALYNSATQAWNHSFYWNCLAPAGEGGKPHEDFDKLIDPFIETATKHFGSGWCWFVYDDNKIKVVDTHDANNPHTENLGVPLLTIDVWEHAYYLDYKNDRANYLDKVWDIINWEFVNEQYERATGRTKEEKETRSS